MYAGQENSIEVEGSGWLRRTAGAASAGSTVGVQPSARGANATDMPGARAASDRPSLELRYSSLELLARDLDENLSHGRAFSPGTDPAYGRE